MYLFIFYFSTHPLAAPLDCLRISSPDYPSYLILAYLSVHVISDYIFARSSLSSYQEPFDADEYIERLAWRTPGGGSKGGAEAFDPKK